jgi:Ser/Thr protein kinase RdoA (MazF antagonist)
MEHQETFDALSPELILDAAERAFDLCFDGSIAAYNSYINRVYGLNDEDGGRWVIKFFRPGRWSAQALQDEIDFVNELAAAELPVIAPICGRDGKALHEDSGFYFTLYPRKGGRTFDPAGGEDWFRLGSLLGRLHDVSANRPAAHRIQLHPANTTAVQIQSLLASTLIPEPQHSEFAALSQNMLTRVSERFSGEFSQLPNIRLHGDCHRGNILDRPGEGLMLIDFDDMANGPAVQDLWMLLPGSQEESRAELEELLEGYESFYQFDRRSLRLIEDLRFMRIIHFLHWCAMQVKDARFQQSFPDWGSKGFWIKEIEDLREQERRME